MGLMVIHGAQAGGFSPISIYGGITNGVVAKAGLPLDPVTTFLASFFVNFAVAGILFVLLGGRQLMSRRAELPGTPARALAGSAGAMARYLRFMSRRPRVAPRPTAMPRRNPCGKTWN